MPYLLLVLGLIIGIYALYRFFIKADINQIKSLILASITITICLSLFILAVTGRLPAAIAIVSAIAPFIVAYYARRTHRRRSAYDHQVSDAPKGPLSIDEAFDILGLDKNATDEEIRAAYKKLMKKVHPDQEGSEWMAAKLNEAKDLLLKKK